MPLGHLGHPVLTETRETVAHLAQRDRLGHLANWVQRAPQDQTVQRAAMVPRVSLAGRAHRVPLALWALKALPGNLALVVLVGVMDNPVHRVDQAPLARLVPSVRVGPQVLAVNPVGQENLAPWVSRVQLATWVQLVI